MTVNRLVVLIGSILGLIGIVAWIGELDLGNLYPQPSSANNRGVSDQSSLTGQSPLMSVRQATHRD